MTRHDLEQAVVRERVRCDPVTPDHRRRGHQRVHDRLLGRFDDGIEQRVDDAVTHGADVVRQGRGRVLVGLRGESVARRERDEQVTARVSAGSPDPGDAETRALGEPLALVGEQRRIGRDHDDDRA